MNSDEGGPRSDERDPFQRNKDALAQSLIAEPLLSNIARQSNAGRPLPVIIDLNVLYPRGRTAARDRVKYLIGKIGASTPGTAVSDTTGEPTHPYVFATLTPEQILELLKEDGTESKFNQLQPAGQYPRGAIFRIWEDSQIHPLILKSVATVKADAAHVAFAANGQDIVWAVLDSGIWSEHPHFSKFRNLDLPLPLVHRDFVSGDDKLALEDPLGHGTHVAGIIAGAMSKEWDLDTTTGVHASTSDATPAVVSKQTPTAIMSQRDSSGNFSYTPRTIDSICGMAPQCKLVSMRILNEQGIGQVGSVIEAIEAIQKLNDFGRNVVIHGVNLSAGYAFDPEWYGCGQTPLCLEVDRLVRSGVVVVVAAGNSGYGFEATKFTDTWAAGIPMTINDPGNSNLAITVGSTHRDKPHTYGISYFSSKGPTGDGRLKPDVVAPGERIISCASGENISRVSRVLGNSDFHYVEDSGTSMAAPHVSGVIAAFLSIRQEYIGRPEDVKTLFTSAATDLGRDRTFQGAGLIDLMRAIQQV